MALNIRPPPLRDPDRNSAVWIAWYRDLQELLTSETGLIDWDAVSKTGSNLTDIATRNHADLQNINTASYTHLTATNHTDLTDGGNTTLHKHTHNSQDSLQGGTTSEYYHLTSAQNSEIGRSDNVNSVSANTSLDDTYYTVLVTANAKTITLPAASAARIGHEWTIILGTAGYVDIARAGSDTLTLPETSTSIRLDNKGASVTLRCLTATSWGIV